MIDESVREEVVRLKEKGVSIATIGRQLGISRGSVYGILNGDLGNDQPSERDRHHRPREERGVIPVTHPSRRVVDEREDVEVTELQVRKHEAVKKLEKLIEPKEHPALVEKRARVEVAKLDLDEYETQKKLETLKEEERRKAQAEREARLEKERERERLEDERRRLADREKWIQGYQDKALTSWLPRGIQITSILRFQIKDEVKKVLANRSEDEDRWELERLVKETINGVIEPYLTDQKAKNKTRLIETWAIPEVERYIHAQGLAAYVDEESKSKIKEYVRSHFMKKLTGTEYFILSHEVHGLLDASFMTIKEKIKQVQEQERKERDEKARQEMERKEAADRAFRNKIEQERKTERIAELIETGMSRFNWYLTIHSKEIGPLKCEEREEAKRHLERELKKEIEGSETDEEVEKIADEILDDFFFE